MKTIKGGIADLQGIKYILNPKTSFVLFSVMNKDLVSISRRKNLCRRRFGRRVR
ncbi:MAG: hypothetical protein PHX25_02235 [Candidatus Pacebacteria bacterium]|nr:hypothetical protein [Candidatus Paceibacterota bacterium]